MELFKLLGTIAINGTDSANKAIDETTGKAQEAGNKLGSVLASIGSAAVKVGAVAATGLSAAAAGIGALSKQSLDAYADYEQLVGGAELMFGDAYDYIAEKSRNAYSTVQMSQNDYLKQVNGFATGLKTALGGNEQAAAELADKIINAEADIVAATGNSQEAVQNAFNGIMKSNFTMLDNLQIGITPTKEGFQEVINKVNAWQKANGKTTNYVIDNLADCQAALVDYIEMVGMQGYAQNEAADTIQGSLSSMKGAWENLLTSFASNEGIDEALTGFVDSIVTVADNIAPRLIGIIPNLVEGIMMVIQQLSPYLIPMIEQLLPTLLEGAAHLITFLIANLPTLLTTLGTALWNAIKLLFTEINTLLPGETDGVFGILRQAFEGFWTFVQTVWETIGKPIFEMIQSMVTILKDWFEESFGSIGSVVGDTFEGISAFWNGELKPCFEAVRSFIEDVLAPAFEEVFKNTILPIVSTVFTAIKTAWETIGVPVWDALKYAISLVRDAFAERMPEIQEFFNNAVADIKEAWEKHLKPAFEAIGNFLEKTLKPIFEMVFKDYILPAVDYVFGAIKKAWESVLKPVFNGICDFLTGVFTGNWEQAWEGIQDILKGVVNGIIGGIEWMVNGAISMINVMLGAIGAVATAVGSVLGLDPVNFTLDYVELPRLAKGGILEKGQMGLLEGDGAEAVVPLENNRKWIASVANDMQTEGIGGSAESISILKDIFSLLESIRENGENLPDELVDAMASSLSFNLNNREFARLVKAVN